MVKNLFLIAIVLTGVSMQAAAQDRVPVELKDSQFFISILDPGVAWEKKVADKQSLRFSFGLTMLADEETNFSDDFGVSLNPVVTGDFRNYYSRKRVKKDLNPNSGNYVALRAGYIFDAITDNVDFGTTETSQSFFMGPVWGIQRNYKSGIHLGLSLGAGFATGNHTDLRATGIGQFNIGFALGR